jgi:ribulose kinase
MSCGVTEPGRFVAIMGTSTCDILLGRELAVVDGMCGVVEDGVLPGLTATRRVSRRSGTSSRGTSSMSVPCIPR